MGSFAREPILRRIGHNGAYVVVHGEAPGSGIGAELKADVAEADLAGNHMDWTLK